MSNQKTVVTIVVVVLAAALLAMTVGASNHMGEGQQAYAGNNVSFDTSENAVVNYTVDGAEIFNSAEVEAKSSAEERGAAGVGAGIGVGAGGGGGVDLSALTDVRGAAVANVNANARASASVNFDSSAEFEAHDNGNGVAVLKSGDEEQLVEVEISADTEAETPNESVVTFTSDGTESSFIVAGEGRADVNEGGNVTANLGNSTNAVVRTYGDEKTEDDEEQERIISEGNAAAEVQFTEQDGDVVGSPAEFLPNTDIETEVNAGESVSLTVDRAESEGKVVMMTVTGAAVGTTEEINVEVDGNAAVEVDSYSELEGGIGEEMRYTVVDGDTEGKAQVLVAVESFSEHQITVEGEEDDTTDNGSTDDTDGTDSTTDDEMGSTDNETDGTDGTDNETMDGGEESDEQGGEGLPGFTAIAALAALTAVALRSQTE